MLVGDKGMSYRDVSRTPSRLDYRADELCATPIGSVGGVYFNGFTLFDEERHLHCETGL